MARIVARWLPLLLTLVLLPVAAVTPAVGADADHYRAGRYHNELKPRVPGDGRVESCADPTVIRGQQPGDRSWYMYCTTDPLNDQDTAGSGPVDFHPVPMMRSRDLVSWTYAGDALTAPEWADEGAGLWAPDVVYSRTFDTYYLTFVVTDVDDAVSNTPGCHGDGAIGVATSDSPTGPWTVSDTPVVPPRHDPDSTDPCAFLWTFDPDVLGDSIATTGILYYGSYYGGIFGTHVALTADGMTTTGAATRVTIGNRYEGANVVRRGGWYYLFASASNCCNGPLTGYSVFAGRSRSPLGPYVDREGNSLLQGRVGGTPVISMNGNRWVGTGHNTVFRDFDGQWWTAYHAVDRAEPYFATEPGFTKRPALLDPLDWRHGWPSVRAGRWASDKAMPAPAAQPGERSTYQPHWQRNDRPVTRLDRFSDTFRGTRLKPRWSWIRKPAATTYGVGGGRFRFDMQAADLSKTQETNASVLTEPTPRRNYVVETKVHLNLPPEGCCHNFVQAGLVIYDNADRFIKLAHVSIWETRQTEFAKEVAEAIDDDHRYGNTVVGPLAALTYLRIVKSDRHNGTGESYTAYTSQDRRRWIRGGTWTHHLGTNARIGLVSMGGAGYPARFDYVRVSTLARGR